MMVYDKPKLVVCTVENKKNKFRSSIIYSLYLFIYLLYIVVVLVTILI